MSIRRGIAGALVVAAVLSAAPAFAVSVNGVQGLAVRESGVYWNWLVDAADGNNLLRGLAATGCYYWSGTDWDRCTGTAGSQSVLAIGATTPSDAFANPTDAVLTFSLLGGWDADNAQWARAPLSTTAASYSNTGLPFLLGTAAVGVELNNGQVTTLSSVSSHFRELVSGIDANGTGDAFDMEATPMSKFTLTVDRTAGATDTVNVAFQCSLDGASFITILAVTDLSAEPVLQSVGDTPCLQVRYNVGTVGAGNTLTVSWVGTR